MKLIYCDNLYDYKNGSYGYMTVLLCLAGVDLRSAKVCELGLLNYKAKHVFYPSEKKKFRCRYDYYCASVFEVCTSISSI